MPLYPNGLGTGVASRVLTIPFGSSESIPSVSNGPGVNSSETATHKVDYDTCDFDATTSESMDRWVLLPSGGTFTATFSWTADSGSGSVVWAISGRAFTDGDALDSALGTAQQVADTLLSAGGFHDSTATPTVTLSGSPAAGKWAVIRVSRLPADASDTLAVDARLKFVTLTFNA